VVLHVPIKAYDLVINNMKMDRTGVASSLLSSWLYIIPKPKPVIATKQKLPNNKIKPRLTRNDNKY
jgi:hypothetical protein